MKRTPFKRKFTNQLKKTPLRKKSKSETATIKYEIQALIREIGIITDGGCVLRKYSEAGACGGYRNDGQLILQAEHLITRSNSNTYGDMRNIVILCRHHHGHFKPQNSLLYWKLIERYVGHIRWAWIQMALADNRPYKVDWKLIKIALQNTLNKLKNENTYSM